MTNSEPLKINESRIWDTLHESCQWGATPDGGMNRLTLTDDDKKVREWLIEEGKKLGCSIKIDEMGSIFMTRPGENNDVPPIAIGSHLDTQPAGGRYDGIVGVHTGLEILRVLHEKQYKTYAPICVVDWTNEEGARFPKTMVASGVWSGAIPLEEAYNLEDINEPGVYLKGELERIGFKGDVAASHKANPFSIHFECHIEQATRLEEENVDIGVVQGCKGIKWYTVELEGKEGHTGTTPMKGRKDALACAADMMMDLEKTAVKHSGIGTVGVIHSSPQSANTIPGKVKFSVDCRHDNNEGLDKYSKEVELNFQEIAKKRGIEFKMEQTWHFKQVEFDATAQKFISESAQENNYSQISLYSGIGHDSCYTSYQIPTAMVFVPCKDGISHNPKEYSSKEQVTKGVQTMLGAVLRYDQHLKEKHSV